MVGLEFELGANNILLFNTASTAQNRWGGGAAPSPGLCAHACPCFPKRKLKDVFPFFRRSWDVSEESLRSTFSCSPGAPSSLHQTSKQVACPASPLPAQHFPHPHALWSGLLLLQ